LIPKENLAGLLYGLAKNSIVIIDSSQTKFGYKITLFTSIRGEQHLLEAVQRTLLQYDIESKFFVKESKSRPKPLLKISRLENLRNLCNFMKESSIHESIMDGWNNFSQAIHLMESGKHYTTKGFDEMLKIKGVLV